MASDDVIKTIATYVGLILGTIGTTLGILNYLRDRARIEVYLQWDMVVSEDSAKTKIGVIRVTNTGRRAIYYSHVALVLPKNVDIQSFLISGGLRGKKITEGDEPQSYTVDQSGLDLYKNSWRQVRAQVTDSTGKVWLSKKISCNQRPSWAQ